MSGLMPRRPQIEVERSLLDKLYDAQAIDSGRARRLRDLQLHRDMAQTLTALRARGDVGAWIGRDSRLRYYLTPAGIERVTRRRASVAGFTALVAAAVLHG